MRTLRSVLLAVFAVVALVAGCSTKQEAPAPPRVTGDFHGNIEIPDHPLAVGVSFANDGKATIDIPAQGVQEKSLSAVQADADAVSFSITKFPGNPSYQGKYDKGADRVTGTFTQAGKSYPLNLDRGKVETPPRPQEPKPPFPYKSEDVSYRSGDITIAGTLTEPNSGGPFPTVVLINGSGANDRNEEILGHKPFLLLSDTLTRAGYAVLRTDKRGVGKTGGNLDTSTYADLTGDIAAGMTFLRGRSEIDAKRIGLLGHSEGGYLGPLYASRPDSGVAFVIMMAGPAVPGSDVLVLQNRLILTAEGASAAEVDKQVGFSDTLATLLRAGDLTAAKNYVRQHNDELPVEKKLSEDDIDALVTPYMAALVGYDPAPALRALRMPVLAFYGTKDLQVPASQSAGPARDLLSADPDATVHVFDGLNHLMQPAGTGSPKEYAGIETTIDPQVLTYVTDWLTQRFPPAH
ncbi:alpha/beta fold hydrolase [Nocardia sp. CDC153]|uniref:alpha/beta hydrolase family protein n=1 Tax=Nocardia sp. CDC153 TaxID=3112167 RepID=UPI002DBC70BB|nr:alpha/beta fold hydrolase [Nocardia sp. CDC153]MEC3958494.1 alpha/beta fold hydrolase [Nocardia sp. CDC153]